MSELNFLSVREMATKIARRQISARELIQAHLDHIAQHNPRLNAVVELYAEYALDQATKADNTPHDQRPPLHGVPMTVKGAWDCKGFRNTAGTLGRKDFIATSDATVIHRMKQAGMIPIGVTNLPEFSMAFESDNLVYGRTNNPFDVTRTPGGSGGGGAAAIASGCSPFEVGGDMGGSIRVPAHFCGIAGLKPTLGRIPLTGYFPGPFGVVTLFACAGPMARTVDDLALTLPMLSGPDDLDAGIANAILGDPHSVTMSKLRVAFHTHNGVHAPTPETAATVEKAARALQPIAASVEQAQPASLDLAYETWVGLLLADGGAGMRSLAAMCGATETSALFQGFLSHAQARETTTEQMGRMLADRDLCRMHIVSFFQNYDVLICPVSAFPALPHGESVRNLSGFSFTASHNLSGCPGVSMRCGTSPQGLPIAVQVVAKPWCEHIALAVAHHLEQTIGIPLPR